MLKPLIINRCYLFDRSPGGECLRTFVKSLNNEKYSSVIYCSDRSPLVSVENNNVKLTKEYRFVRYIAAAIRRILLPDLMNLPGYEWFSWGIGAKRKILNDIKSGEKYDYIHSVSFPCASHKVALEIKRKTGLPWVMQLYDPWADNPYRIFKMKFFKDIDWKQERECVDNADLIIHDNEAIAELWRVRYGEEISKKIVVMPLTVNLPKTDIKINQYKNGDKLIISHIGNFMLNRTSKPFIRAVAVFVSRYPQFRNKLKINFIGQVTDQEKELIQMNNLHDLFNLTGTISLEDCETYYKESDVFLAIDGINKDNLFFPSKILKYLYYRRPILGITPCNSVLDYELRQSGHTSISNGNLEEIVEYLKTAIINYESLLNFDQEFWLKFEPSNIIRYYDKLVQRIVKNNVYRI